MLNLKEIDSLEGCLWLAQSYFCKRCKEEEKVKKMGQFSGTKISQTTGLISFKFGMWGCIYGGHKIYQLIEIGPVVIEIQGVKNGELAIPVNSTLVCHTALLAADTQLCVLIYLL